MEEFKGSKELKLHKEYFRPGLFEWVIRNGEKLIATIHGCNEEAQADAQLITAAPELLKALINIKEWFSKLEDWSGIGDPNLDEINSAIQKALGEEL